jgi:hypothetical protein
MSLDQDTLQQSVPAGILQMQPALGKSSIHHCCQPLTLE